MAIAYRLHMFYICPLSIQQIIIIIIIIITIIIIIIIIIKCTFI